MPRSNSIVARLAMIVAGVLLGGGVVELALRMLGPPRQASELRQLHETRPDRPWLYGLRPGASGELKGTADPVRYDINTDGFRDRLYERPKPQGVFRTLVLGDSLAFGWGVAQDQAFPKVMESLLAEQAPDARVEILNLGVGGYNPYTELELLKDLGPSYEPDLVLVQFCINDFNDPTLHFDFHSRQRLGAIPDAAYPDPSARRDPASVAGLGEQLCDRLEVCSRLYEAWSARTVVTPDKAAKDATAKALLRSQGPEWDWLEARYRDMATASRGMGADFAVLVFPHPGQLTSDAEDPVQQSLSAIGERHGWPTVNLLPAFRRATRSRQMVFLDWWHPNPLGHRIAAREAIVQLACAGALPSAASDPCVTAGIQ